ncbi:MAG: pre-peptidase C-terminal domain-containing protein [Myxococcales bacterium]|nr:pre-peptidase C-terminal domain-containing protein [Myxococcales bacterium]MCB9525561.1 pre-peptidase C-terminal domain-containing protein [Myxococcales bacterium]
MRRLFLAPVALLSILSVVGCSGAEEEPAATDMGAQRDSTTPAGCMSDLTCGNGRVCVDGECRLGQCNNERTCPAGQTCDRATFTCSGSEDPPCAEDSDCQGVAVCDAGECRAVQCRNNADCDPNEECTAQNRCVAMVAECVDTDGDGYGLGCEAGDDCDDRNPQAYPGAPEDGQTNCDDGVDNNCDGADSRCGAVDTDGDGFSDDEDCAPNNPEINPGRSEVPYNGEDDDCDAATRDDDLDGDGYGRAEDCDDRAVNINPEGRDIPGNGIDEDCDGMDAMPSADDVDGDGVTEADGDCDDNNAEINPNAAEVPYNGRDDDCNADTRDNDLDGDGFDSPQDCADDNPAINPNAAEVYYNNLDDDCNAETVDGDQDGDGVLATQAGGQDCNDSAAAINPEADEVPYNGQDDDCDPATRDDDVDGDGFNREADCDDNNADVNPDVVENAETNCDDGVDNDCRGGDVMCDAGAPDADGDGIPDDQDCAPNNADVPGATEIPGNGIDDDCNPATPDVVEMCDDDAFDRAAPNGSRETATGVEDGNRLRGQYEGLVICGEDDDWYRIDLQAGDGLEVDVRFDAADGDVDVRLQKLVGGQLVFVDSSNGVGDMETVYERRAAEAATYFITVFRFRDGAGRSPYGMTVNVFAQCQDDAEGFRGEHSDERTDLENPNVGAFPLVQDTRQICDHDDDWYQFIQAEAGNVRLDLLFTHAQGDIDMQLFAEGQDAALTASTSSTDNELIVRELPAGTYHVRVYGFRGAKNRYKLFRTSGQVDSTRVTYQGGDIPVPDYAGGVPGEASLDLEFDAPAGSVIRNLRIRDLDINHSFLRDLRVTALWNGVPVAILWDRQGALDGTDGGEDDDFLPFTGGDINFDNRDYPQFSGLPARGTFTLLVEDLAINDEGEIADLDVEIEYLVP